MQPVRLVSIVFTGYRLSTKLNRIFSTSTMSHFSLSDYDCIGFDLDNTLCTYNITNMVKLEYDLLAKYLIEKKGYDQAYLNFEKNADLFQRGLIMDFEKGNLLRVDSEGCIKRSTHGTKLLSDDDVAKIYGENKKWDLAVSYINNPLSAWNTDLEKKLRSCLDFFDVPAAVCFVQCVDAVDEKKLNNKKYTDVWADILDGLYDMFIKESLSLNRGGYFPALRKQPGTYINKCSESVLSWLKMLKAQNKITFLLTGSYEDFANLTTGNCIGENWKDYFDIIIYHARKPGFFIQSRKFVEAGDNEETKEIEIHLRTGLHEYCQGNWTDLQTLLSYLSKKKNPKSVYIGDNLVQDIYAPSKNLNCDTIAMVEEMAAEGVQGQSLAHKHSKILVSKFWGSFFTIETENKAVAHSFWSSIINKYSKICIPSLEYLAEKPIDYKFKSFEGSNVSGYNPGIPKSLI